MNIYYFFKNKESAVLLLGFTITAELSMIMRKCVHPVRLRLPPLNEGKFGHGLGLWVEFIL
jgi:hypothetical protein